MIVTTSAFMALEGFITSGYDGIMVCAANLQSGLNLIVASSDPYVEADMLDPWYPEHVGRRAVDDGLAIKGNPVAAHARRDQGRVADQRLPLGQQPEGESRVLVGLRSSRAADNRVEHPALNGLGFENRGLTK
jgi:hypothetical protein